MPEPSRFKKIMMKVIYSRWVASLIVALAVSYSFHLVENRTDTKIEREHRVLECTVLNLGIQSYWKPSEIRTILDDCDRKQK